MISTHASRGFHRFRRRAFYAPLVVISFQLGPASAVAGEPLFDPYGFIRLDGIYNDSRMQNPQFAFWVLSEDPQAGYANDQDLSIHPRVTRLGLKINPSPLSDHVTARGVVEIDFQNGGTESRETPRMRLAYFEISTGPWRFLAGQDWDVMSPLYPTCHTDGVLWNAGNLGDRRPQATVAFAPTWGETQLEVVVGAAQAGAIDGQNLDANPLLDGVDSSTPQLQGRVQLGRDTGGGTLKVGAWGHYAETQTERSVRGDMTFKSWSAGGDASVPLGSRVVIQGEAWVGENVSDVRGGVGQGINPLTGDPVASKGGWGEVGLKITEPLSIYAGGSVDDPDDEDVPSAADIGGAGLPLGDVGRTLNRVAYVSARWRPWSPFLVGAEYYYWVTEYRGLERGNNNRIDLHLSYWF
jgi:hypothetical protein